MESDKQEKPAIYDTKNVLKSLRVPRKSSSNFTVSSRHVIRSRNANFDISEIFLSRDVCFE